MSIIRLNYLEAIEKIVIFISNERFINVIDKLFLLGSMITTKLNPNDIDLMFIGSFKKKDKSVLRFQQELRSELKNLVDCPLSINFGSSIDMIHFADGLPIEAYLMVYSRQFKVNINFTKWFTFDGKWKQDEVRTLGFHDSEIFRNTVPYNALSLSFTLLESQRIQLEAIQLPREAFWEFLNKRCNAQLPIDENNLIHPIGWIKCYRSGRCCQNFEELRYRFMPEIPRIFDIIKNDFSGMLWNAVEIQSEGEWFWLVENGLNDRLKHRITNTINDKSIIPCPFWEKPTDSLLISKCIIWKQRPDACERFPEFKLELEKYNCNKN
ncbi:MAG: hypothetical protein ACXAC7_12425 [Candidatus Hodarchaeales archaeon]|jgi:Fe-S-cluster containining protein